MSDTTVVDPTTPKIGQGTDVTRAPTPSIVHPTMPRAAIIAAHHRQVVADVGMVLTDLATLMHWEARAEGPPDQAKLGGLAVGLRRAAWRLEHGDLDGFADGELARLIPRESAS